MSLLVSISVISFQLQHDPIAKSLSVFILEADGLPALDLGGTSDPYVTISLLPEREQSKTYETRVHQKTVSPVFNECFVFPVSFNKNGEKVRRNGKCFSFR